MTPVNFAKFLRTTFLQNTSGRLLLLLAFQKQPFFYENVLLKISQNSQENSFCFEKFSKNLFYRTDCKTASAFSFSEAATGEVLWKNVFLKISQNSKENTFALQIFKNTFFTEHLWTTGSGFFVQRYWNGILPTVFGKPQMNIHYLETLTLEVLFRYIISFSAG